jgi:hypothetical protein
VRHWTLTTLREKLIKIGGEGRAPFREDRLLAGGSGGSARVVPGHSGKDWAPEIARSGIWMKEKVKRLA